MSVPADLMGNTANATSAYSDALKQARNASNSLFLSYGFQAPDATGNYSTKGAQDAFNPMTLFANADATPDLGSLQTQINGLQVGGSGKLADIVKSGASDVSNADIAMAGRGFNASGQEGAVTGGLVTQREDLARSTAQANLQAGKNQFVSDYGMTLQPLGQASRDTKAAEEGAKITDRLTAAEQQVWGGITSTIEGMGGSQTSTNSSLPTIGAGKGSDTLKSAVVNIVGNAKIGPSAKKTQLAALKASYNLTPQQAAYVDAQLAKMK